MHTYMQPFEKPNPDGPNYRRQGMFPKLLLPVEREKGCVYSLKVAKTLKHEVCIGHCNG